MIVPFPVELVTSPEFNVKEELIAFNPPKSKVPPLMVTVPDGAPRDPCEVRAKTPELT